MKRRDIVPKLRAAGLDVRDDGGNHANVYRDGQYLAALPRHSGIEANTVRAIERQTGVKLL